MVRLGYFWVWQWLCNMNVDLPFPQSSSNSLSHLNLPFTRTESSHGPHQDKGKKVYRQNSLLLQELAYSASSKISSPREVIMNKRARKKKNLTILTWTQQFPYSKCWKFQSKLENIPVPNNLNPRCCQGWWHTTWVHIMKPQHISAKQ